MIDIMVCYDTICCSLVRYGIPYMAKVMMRIYRYKYGVGGILWLWFGMVRYGMGGYSEDKWVLTIRIMARAGWH